MKLTCKELRDRAWESLRGLYWELFLLFLILVVINGVVGSFTMGLLSLLMLPMAYAVAVAFLNASRQKAKPEVGSLFTIYRDDFSRAFLVPFLVQLFIALWTLLLIIPGIIMGYAYSMAMYIANDNPELRPIEAVKRSKELMRGHKWDLFVLDLSFLGWILLAMLTCGVGLVFLVPYIEMAHVEFYRELTDKAEDVQTA